MDPLLDPAPRRFLDALLDEEAGARRHFVVTLGGARAGGFAGPEAAIELQAVHVDDTRRLLGFAPPPRPEGRRESCDGIEVAYSSIEVQPLLAGLLQGDGGCLERLLGPSLRRDAAGHDELRSIATRALSRLVYQHYARLATAGWRGLDMAAEPSLLQLLESLRAARTGTQLLREGGLVLELAALLDGEDWAAARGLIDRARSGDAPRLDAAEWKHLRPTVKRALAELDRAYAGTALPAVAANRGEVEEWLFALRRQTL